jgi:hypothetical protein
MESGYASKAAPSKEGYGQCAPAKTGTKLPANAKHPRSSKK